MVKPMAEDRTDQKTSEEIREEVKEKVLRKLSIKEEWEQLPSWVRMLLLVGGILAIIKWFPIVDLLWLLMYCVVIPLGFLTFVGCLATETTDHFIGTWTAVMIKIKQEVKEAAANANNEETSA